jgi:nitrite reductase/ring-hydroxylating ferredoxin subunit
MTHRVLLCDSASLENGGPGHCFKVLDGDYEQSAFAIRYQDQAHGYLNRCAHVAMTMDWKPGEFFEDDKRYIMCATHGAIYEPDSGQCVGGPCRGARLEKLDVLEESGQVFWIPNAQYQCVETLFKEE